MKEAILLAGGFGTRLRQVVPDCPKAMAPICGRPFLEILLEVLARKRFERVVLSLGYMADVILSHFGKRFAGIDLVYEIEPTALGTGGAVRRALDRCEAEHVFVFNGDTYLDLEVEDVDRQWYSEKMPIIVAREVEDTARYGRLSIAGARIVGFVEKGTPGRGLINAGCYLFPRDIVRKLPQRESFSLENDFLKESVGRLPLTVFVSRGQFIDIGVPEDYARAQTELARVCH